jgi:dsDNA-specific endonuclease/ATPase MutS2
VASLLAGHRRVESFAHAPLEQGGAGMTRARLAV